jgi:hypothetical protein
MKIGELIAKKILIFSDDGGSDSSIDDGLPKHLEVIAAAKVNLF